MIHSPRRPNVSVVIPVFNTAPYLKQCLDSLLSQTLNNIEIICVDNGSTDDSLNILKEYGDKHDNIVILVHPEGRQAGARNAGMDVANGTYIGFVDSDDFVSADMFQRLYDAAQATNASVSVCNVTAFNDKGSYNSAMLPNEYFSVDGGFHIIEKPQLLRNTTACNKLYLFDFQLLFVTDELAVHGNRSNVPCQKLL